MQVEKLKARLCFELYFPHEGNLAISSRPFTFMRMLADRAFTILHEWVKSESLRKHCYAVADSMRHFADLRGADADLWEAVGLLHDMDYERHPNQEQSPTKGHPFVGVAALREEGWSEEVCRA